MRLQIGPPDRPRSQLNQILSSSPGRASLDGRADAAPHGASRAPQVPIEPDSGRLADQILLRDITPGAAILAVVAIVSHHQIVTRRHVADERRYMDATGGVLVATHVAAHAIALAARQHRLAVERDRTEDRLVRVGAELLVG